MASRFHGLVMSPAQSTLLVVPAGADFFWWASRFFSIAGEPLDRTYTINPQHMLVRHPRNMNDDDLGRCDDSAVFPKDVPTEMSFFIQRINLAETCRGVADTLPLGAVTITELSLELLGQIDNLFEDGLARFPPFMALDAVLPTAPAYFPLQRASIHMGFHARRARLFRPFLDPGVKPHHARFRSSCLRSALAVLQIASNLLRQSMDPMPPRPHDISSLPESLAPHRSGTVINHLFMACAVLATDPALGARADARPHDLETETRRGALADACRLLERAGEGSPIAASVMSRLVAVFRLHSVHGVHVGQSQGQGQRELQAGRGETVQPPALVSPLVVGSGAVPGAGFTMTGADPFCLVGQDIFDVNGLWDDFISAMPGGDGWGPLFADLDSFCGQV